MRFDIPAGHKFAFIALDNAGTERGLPAEIGLGERTWAVLGPPVNLPRHWQEWLGSVQAEHLNRATLTFVAIRPSNAVGVLDGENQQLSQCALTLFYSLLLVDVFHYDAGLLVTGANVDGEVAIRQVTTLEPFYRPPGVMPERIGAPWLQSALAIAQGMRVVHATPGTHQRLRRGFHAWTRAMQEFNGEDRLHQFVRAVEALVKPEVGRSKNQFMHRGQVFAGNAQHARERLGELYDLRGAAEHMNPLDAVLAGYREAERGMIGLKRSYESQVLASYVYERILTHADLQITFSSDDRIDEFWAKPRDDQVAAWGVPIDVDAVADGRFTNDLAAHALG
jgi:hypothetical protein